MADLTSSFCSAQPRLHIRSLNRTNGTLRYRSGTYKFPCACVVAIHQKFTKSLIYEIHSLLIGPGAAKCDAWLLLHKKVSNCCILLITPTQDITASSHAILDASAVTTGVKRNENIGKLQAGYLFPEVSFYYAGNESMLQSRGHFSRLMKDL